MSRSNTTSNRLFEIMKEQGISQVELSRRTGIATSTISDWKRKGNTPTADKITLVCQALNISPEKVLGICQVDYSASRVIDKDEPLWELVEVYDKMDKAEQQRMVKYFMALVNANK